MDEIFWRLLKRLRHYGEILTDESRLDHTGAWRSTLYQYHGVKYYVLMHDGKIVGIW
jgi:hypothetical protein